MFAIQQPQMEPDMAPVTDVARFLEDVLDLEQAADALLSGADLGPSLPGVDWKRCLLRSCRLAGAGMGRSFFHNVVFEKCDLSGADLSDCVFTAVQFRQCKLTGAMLGGCGLSDVLFEDCLLDYAVFSTSRAKGLLFRECRMAEVQLADITGKQYGFADCHLERANFHHTALAGVDFTNSVIDGIQVSGGELRGAKVTALQACELARLLGVEIV